MSPQVTDVDIATKLFAFLCWPVVRVDNEKGPTVVGVGQGKLQFEVVLLTVVSGDWEDME